MPDLPFDRTNDADSGGCRSERCEAPVLPAHAFRSTGGPAGDEAQPLESASPWRSRKRFRVSPQNLLRSSFVRRKSVAAAGLTRAWGILRSALAHFDGVHRPRPHAPHNPRISILNAGAPSPSLSARLGLVLGGVLLSLLASDHCNPGSRYVHPASTLRCAPSPPKAPMSASSVPCPAWQPSRWSFGHGAPLSIAGESRFQPHSVARRRRSVPQWCFAPRHDRARVTERRVIHPPRASSIQAPDSARVRAPPARDSVDALLGALAVLPLDEAAAHRDPPGPLGWSRSAHGRPAPDPPGRSRVSGCFWPSGAMGKCLGRVSAHDGIFSGS